MLFHILALLLVALAARSTFRRLKYDLHKVPTPGGFPLLGQTLDFLCGQASRELSLWTNASLRKLGNPKLMRATVLGQNLLFVTDLQFIRSVMFSRTDPFPKQQGNELLLTMLGSSEEVKIMVPAALPSPYVKAVRRIYSNAFQSSALKASMEKIERVLNQLLDVIEEMRKDGPINVQELYARLSLDIISQVALDLNLGGLDGSQNTYEAIMTVAVIARKRYTNPLLKPYYSLFPHSKEAKYQSSALAALTAEWERLASAVLERECPPEGEDSIWYGLKTLIDPETSKPITKGQLMFELATVVAAGMDITGQQLAWIFALLASHPRVVNKLMMELTEHDLCGDELRPITFEELADLPYVTAVMKEGLRLMHVTVTSFPRVVPKDMSIVGYRIPKDTIIFAPSDMGFSSEEQWGDPDTFRPERWLIGEDMSEKYNMPFLVGPRDCPGQRLALLEMRMVIIELVRRYHLSIEGTFEELKRNSKDGIVVEADGGIWVNFTPRVLFPRC